ncbi:MAG TPA: RibD family protein [Spirochaetia bacterium]
MRAVQVLLSEGPGDLPVVTLSWAQSADGAIAAADGTPAALSGPESLCLTHRLRTLHDAILVGIQTVLNDDPLLSSRLVEGRQPQPVVLDAHLRFPLTARLLARVDRKPWIFCHGDSSRTGAALRARGARLFEVDADGGSLDLRAVLAILRSEGIASMMVEGGARVLRSFLAEGLARQVVVTTSPTRLSGVEGPGIPRCVRSIEEAWGADTVFWGIPG